ncbi:MAG: choice-of-anchor D domain-containing protein, partial [Terriglobia bacterium]
MYTVTGANGIGPFQASTDAVDFGNVPVGQTAESSLTLVNQGSTAVSVSDLKVSGNEFAVGDTSSLPITVAANSTYNVNLRFKPETSGGSTGQLTVSSSSKGSPSLKVKLHGQGSSTRSATATLSALSCSQSSISGSGSDSCTVTLTGAAGTGGLMVTLASSNSAVSVPGSVTVPAGSSSAGFAATVSAVTSAQSATLTASAGGATQTYSIGLGAYAPSGSPALQMSSTNLNFGSATVNSKSAAQSVTLTSSGTAPLIIDSASLSGLGFSMSGASFPLTLDPGQSAALT